MISSTTLKIDQVVKVISHKIRPHRRSRRTAQSYSPGCTHEDTLAPPGKYDWTCASFSLPESTTKTASRSVKPLLHSSRQKVSILYNGRLFPPKLSLSIGGSGSPSNLWFLGTIQTQNPNGISVGSAVFAQTTVEYPYTLQWDAGSQPKICPFPWGDLEPHPIHGSTGPPVSST